jgi:hypothetical protein
MKAAEIWLGEKGGVGASGLLDEPGGRGVDPLDDVPGPNCTGVLCDDTSVDLGVSVLFDLALLGVDLVIVGRRVSPVLTMMSEGVIASAQGLFEVSSATTVFLALLSLRLSFILFGSPLTAVFLTRPDELEPELDSPAALLELILDVSMVSPLLGDLPLPAIEMSSSTHPAGVGGTGPSVDIGGGLRVGGDVRRSVPRVML